MRQDDDLRTAAARPVGWKPGAGEFGDVLPSPLRATA